MKESKIVAASCVWNPNDADNETSIFSKIERSLQLCAEKGVQLVVFPALIGTLFDGELYLEQMLRLSAKFNNIYICPGSFWEKKDSQCYHSSCLISNHAILLWQRQLYLSKWEQDAGLSRGIEVAQVEIEGFRTSIILSTDVFYPQVSRQAALSGTDLVLSPVAIKGTESKLNPCSQLRGLWQNVQSNMFFAVESGLKGTLHSLPFYSRSIVHAPLAMTIQEDGFLADEDAEQDLIVTQLDNSPRNRVLQQSFNPLRQLNPVAYASLF